MNEHKSSERRSQVEDLRPAERCAICGRRRSDVGGVRLVSQKERGIRVMAAEKNPGGRKHHPVPGRPGLWVAIYGEGPFQEDKVRDRVLAQLEQGYRPWFCQGCGGRSCAECGAPLGSPVGSDYIADNSAHTFHVPMLPGGVGCTNSACRLYKHRSDAR